MLIIISIFFKQYICKVSLYAHRLMHEANVRCQQMVTSSITCLCVDPH